MCARQHAPLAQSILHKPGRDASIRPEIIVPATSNTRRLSLNPDIDDLVPSEASLRHSVFDSAPASSFPKVLRRRLDDFFSDGNISPKADLAMWVKIAVGLAVLAGSWIALYALQAGFMEVRRPLPFERPRADLPFAEHRARQQPQRHLVGAVRQQSPELCFRCLRNQLLHVAHPPSSRPPLLHQSPRRRRRTYRTRHLSVYAPRTAGAAAAVPAYLRAVHLRALFSRLCVREGL